jgi:hypothetical protein
MWMVVNMLHLPYHGRLARVGSIRQWV